TCGRTVFRVVSAKLMELLPGRAPKENRSTIRGSEVSGVAFDGILNGTFAIANPLRKPICVARSPAQSCASLTTSSPRVFVSRQLRAAIERSPEVPEGKTMFE